MARSSPDLRQPYPRNPGSLLSLSSMYPKPAPLPLEDLHIAIKAAFERSLKSKTGSVRKIPDNPEKLVNLCLKHLKERSDPIVGTAFYSSIKAEEIFQMDAISHEMQRQRMQVGIFYQFLIINLMNASKLRGNKYIIGAADDPGTGDIIADIKPPNFGNQIKLYMSVKKSADTVGGQDVEGVIAKLEKIPKQDKNLNSPYLCVIAIATPKQGKMAL